MFFLMILRKVYKKGEKVRIFKCYTSSPYFYGWVGNSVTISTAFVNDLLDSSLQGFVLLRLLVEKAEQDFYLLLVGQVFVHFIHKLFLISLNSYLYTLLS